MGSKKKHGDQNYMAEELWKFIRGDTSTKDFEKWVYAHDNLESLFGENLYLEIISSDFSDKESLYKIRNSISEFLTSIPSKCRCIELSDNAIVDMDENTDTIFQHFDTLKRRGKQYWWLSVDKCRECYKVWLVASDVRQNDIYCLLRINDQSLTDILDNNIWPSNFNTYESVLRIGLEAGKSVRFYDLIESPLLYTIKELARERPQILVSEIAELLNLNIEVATLLSKTAVEEENVKIKF